MDIYAFSIISFIFINVAVIIFIGAVYVDGQFLNIKINFIAAPVSFIIFVIFSIVSTNTTKIGFSIFA